MTQMKRPPGRGLHRLAVEAALPPSPDDTVLDARHLARQTVNDHALAADILLMFLDMLDASAAKLRGAANATIQQAEAHRLKGTAAGIGASRVVAHVSDIERLAARGTCAPDVMLDALDVAIASTKTVANAYLADLGGNPGSR